MESLIDCVKATMNTTHTISTTPTSTVPLSPDERAAEDQLLDRFVRFWTSHANDDPRTTFDQFVAGTPLAEGVELEEATADGVFGWWVLPRGHAQPVKSAVLYLHGGAYVLGSAAAYRGFASQIAVRADVSVFVLDYPLAPEHPFPAAHDAALAAVRWLTRSGVKQLAVAGDSAGGGLSLSTLASRVRAMEAPALTAGVVFSPWTDLSLSGGSVTDPTVRDVLLARDCLADSAAKYLGDTAARDPVASPLFGIPAGMPPIYIQVGGDELLLDDATRYATCAREQGVAVRLEVWDGLHHVFQLNVAELQSSRIALERVSDFLNGYLRG
jgi:epsilon-lactone hydrolase